MIYEAFGTIYSVSRINGDLVGAISKDKKQFSMYDGCWLTLEELKMIIDFMNICE